MSYHPSMTTLDPILPLPVRTGLPEVRQGDGKTILKNDGLSESGMTNRAFFMAWEQVERRAAENYPKYVGGTLDYVAQAWLEAAIWFRRKAYPGIDIEPISETKAQKIRTQEAETAKKNKGKKVQASEAAPEQVKSEAGKAVLGCPKCGEGELIKIKVNGVPHWKCFECEHRWPREAPGSPAKASKHAKHGESTKKSKEKHKKSKKKGKKKARD